MQMRVEEASQGVVSRPPVSVTRLRSPLRLSAIQIYAAVLITLYPKDEVKNRTLGDMSRKFNCGRAGGPECSRINLHLVTLVRRI
jgi:hypothetical protein